MLKKNIYIGEDNAEHLINSIQVDVEKLTTSMERKDTSREDCFNMATGCHICSGKFKEVKKVSSFLYYSLFA